MRENEKGQNRQRRSGEGAREDRRGNFRSEAKRFSDRRDHGEKRGERRFEDRRVSNGSAENRRNDRPARREGDFERRRFGGERTADHRGNDRQDRPARGFENSHARAERRFDSKRPYAERADRRPARQVAPKTARDIALTALADVVRNEAYASQALDRALTGAELSPEDRRLAASIFYFAVENRLQIEWALGGLMENRPEPLVNDILHIAAAQILFMDRIPDHAAVDEAVKMVRNAGRPGLDKLVNAVLRSLIRARDEGGLNLPNAEEDPIKALSVKCSLCEPAVRRLVDAYGAELAEQIAAYAPKERTLTVRPNLTKISCDEFEKMLDREGLCWKRGAVENAYVLEHAGSLSAHEAYKRGLFSIQGESSMLAAQAVGAKRGMQILDACSAPGGKTCLMAEAMGGSGRVHAWDVHPHRVELVRAAARRLELENVRPAVHDATKPMESMELMMDAVLVDAPCSGLGVMADKPDIKFRMKEEDLVNILPLQKKILEACAQAVKVGGRLVYSTCTILPEENECQVRAFLQAHPQFELDADASWLPEHLRDRMQDGMLQLLPARDGVEGFFIARMIRRSL